MKIKRYNIEQLKKYSVVLSPAEQLMLLGGNRYEEKTIIQQNNNEQENNSISIWGVYNPTTGKIIYY